MLRPWMALERREIKADKLPTMDNLHTKFVVVTPTSLSTVWQLLQNPI